MTLCIKLFFSTVEFRQCCIQLNQLKALINVNQPAFANRDGIVFHYGQDWRLGLFRMPGRNCYTLCVIFSVFTYFCTNRIPLRGWMSIIWRLIQTTESKTSPTNQPRSCRMESSNSLKYDVRNDACVVQLI